MITEEYVVKLTISGKIRVWEEAVQEYTRSLGEVERVLVVAAGAIREIATQPGAEGYATDAGWQWWADLEQLPRGRRFVVLTRLARAGVELPARYTLTSV
jgi:hypothetical protein